MKKEHIRKYECLYRHFSIFFWQKCDICGRDFRRERGWRAIVFPWGGGVGRDKYLCHDCAPTFEAANDYFLNYCPRRLLYPPPMRGQGGK